MGFDDGEEENLYVVDNENQYTRFRIKSSASIATGWQAGTLVIISAQGANSSFVDQNNDNAGTGLRARHRYLFVKSNDLGMVRIGRASSATFDLIFSDLGELGVAASSDVSQWGGNLFLRDRNVSGAGGLLTGTNAGAVERWSNLFPDLDAARPDIVRYDTPSLKGLTLSAAWGEDDIQDAALRYKGEAGDFKIAFGLGYYVSTDDNPEPSPDDGRLEIRETKGSGSILHVPTGLFASAAFFRREFGGADPQAVSFACGSSAEAAAARSVLGCSSRADFNHLWGAVGLRRDFWSIGPASIYAEVARADDGLTGQHFTLPTAAGGAIEQVTDSKAFVWGFGLVQQLDSAPVELYAIYRHFEADVAGLDVEPGTIKEAPLTDLDVVAAGARIRF